MICKYQNCELQTIVCKAIKPADGGTISTINMYNHTQVYVPEGVYWDYAFSEWSSFVRIKEMAMDTEGLEGGFVVFAFASRFVKTTLYKANKNEIHKQKEYFV